MAGNHEKPSAAEGRNQGDEIRQMTADFADTRGCAIDPRGDYPRVSAMQTVHLCAPRAKNFMRHVAHDGMSNMTGRFGTPEGRQDESPGHRRHRPGIRSPKNPIALNGLNGRKKTAHSILQNHLRAFLRRHRGLIVSLSPLQGDAERLGRFPRALPWAGFFRPFQAGPLYAGEPMKIGPIVVI